MRDCILVTGGAGFIGSNFVLSWLAAESGSVVNLDLLTYAGNPANLTSVDSDLRYRLVRGDICDASWFVRSCTIINLALSSTSPLRVTSIVPLLRQTHSFAPTSMEPTSYSIRPAPTGSRSQKPTAEPFAFFTSPLTKCMARLPLPTLPSANPRPTRPTVRTPLQRPHPTIWSAHITTPLVCRRLRPTAQTTTARISSRKKLFRCS